MRRAAQVIDDLRPDWIVLCGDILPDFSMISGKGNRLDAQRGFWNVYRSCFIRDDAVTTLVRGNHEIEGFRDSDLARLPARLQDRVVRLEGVPMEFGSWGWSREWGNEELTRELQGQLRECPAPQIYLSHVPPYGYLDRASSGEHIGHRQLFQHLDRLGWPEALVICGHVHECFGMIQRGNTVMVNVSCGYALLEVLARGVTLKRMERLADGGM